MIAPTKKPCIIIHSLRHFVPPPSRERHGRCASLQLLCITLYAMINSIHAFYVRHSWHPWLPLRGSCRRQATEGVQLLHCVNSVYTICPRWGVHWTPAQFSLQRAINDRPYKNALYYHPLPPALRATSLSREAWAMSGIPGTLGSLLEGAVAVRRLREFSFLHCVNSVYTLPP